MQLWMLPAFSGFSKERFFQNSDGQRILNNKVSIMQAVDE
jgi:hypothetical protein